MTLCNHIARCTNASKPLRSLIGACLLSLSMLSPSGAHASVVINGTRVIFPGQNREATVRLNNEGKAPALVQVWIDKGQSNEDPDTLKVPFAVSPPIALIDPGKGQVLRVVYVGDPLPADRESVFWFNMLEVPPKVKKEGDANRIQFAVRTRIKLFYRPPGLPGTADDAIKGLHWSWVRDGDKCAVKITNNAPYYVSLTRTDATVGGHTYVADGNGLVPPRSTVTFVFRGLSADTAPGSIDLETAAINDYGARIKLTPTLTP
jgi:chaperone protein EcpD